MRMRPNRSRGFRAETRRQHRKRAVALALLALTVGGCGWLKRAAYEDFGRRDDWQNPEAVVAALAIAKGQRVADLGSGGGYFTFRLAEAVGPDGRVYAVDIDPGMNAHVAEEAEKRGLAQVETVLAAEDDPRLPEAVDLLFTSNTYHHLTNRVAYFTGLQAKLAPGAKVAVLDYKPEETSHSTAADVVKKEMQEAGYRLVEEQSLERQTLLVFVLGAP